MQTILPAAKGIALCENHNGYPDGRVDLYSVFNAIHPRTGYPYSTQRISVFAQLVNGLGEVPFFVDVRHAETEELVFTTNTYKLVFPSRSIVVQMAMRIEGCNFPLPGLYLFQLFCDNNWVCDTGLLLHE